MSFRSKLILALAPILVISLLVTGRLFISGGREAIQEATKDQLKAVASMQRNRLAQIVEQEFRILSSLSSRWKLRKSLQSFSEGSDSEGNRTIMNTILGEAKASDALLRDIFVVGLNGHIIASTKSDQIGLPAQSEMGFPAALEKPVLAEFFFDDSGRESVYLAAPLHIDDKAIGALIVHTDASMYIDPTQDRSGLGETGEVVLARRAFGGEGARFLTPLRSDVQGALNAIDESDASLPIVRALRQEEGFFTGLSDYRHVPVYAVTRYLPEAGFAIVAKIEQREVLASVAELDSLFWKVFFVSLLVQFLAIVVVAHSVTRPLRTLTEAAGSLEDNTGQLPAVASRDEVGILTNTLRRMVDKIREGYQLKADKEAAEAANAAKSAFFAHMSHEIRTPMHSVIGFLQLALESNTMSKELRRYIDTAYRSASSLLILIDDVLDYSRLEDGKIRFEKVAFSLPRMLKERLQTLELQASEKRLELTLDYPDNIERYVIGDPVRLGQVIINLVSNAIKFTETGSVEIKVSREDGQFHFTVIDTGIGIPKDRLATIFNSFTQADLSTTRRFGGTGLGTTIAKQIVEQMGGRIWAESEVGQGSQFHVLVDLPLAAKDQLPDESNIHFPRESVTAHPLNVLLVDDVEVNVVLASIRLKQRGHHVQVARNGQEALDMIAKFSFDVVLMDVQMPIMDGLEATRRIRMQEQDGEHLPIIAMSASVLKEEQQACFDTGMDDFVLKPIDFDHLFAILDERVPVPC